MMNIETMKMREEIKNHLTEGIIPFWKGMRDDEFGGYYGYLDYDLNLDKKAEKGCILNSRITWFFSNAYTLLKDESLLDEAKHGYAFLKDYCLDKEYGGIYWSLNYDGTPKDTTKHTYNQAFCIYALSSYYEASGDTEALELAKKLFTLIETTCMDEVGYLEAFTRDFKPESNEKLSENGVLADKTMNTLLHVFEAYTELYRVSGDEKVRRRLLWIMDLFAEKIYNPKLHRQEVFFDREWNTLISTRSGGSKCPYCSGYIFLKGFNDLQTTHPEIASEWSEKNLPLKPDEVNAKSRKNVWWRCGKCGNEWKSVINARVKGTVCPVCAEREVLAGYNDLATTDRPLLSEWDYEQNKLKPTEVSRTSAKRAWWKCRHGHSWSMKINERATLSEALMSSTAEKR